MAWLSGLADKAEILLNKIDKNTAAVLNKDKYDLPQPQLTEVTWNPPEPRHANTSVTNSPLVSRHFPHIRSTPNLASLATSSTTSFKDDELLTFLNTPDASPKKIRVDTSISPPTPSSLIVEHPTDSTDSTSDMSLYSNCSSPHFISTTLDAEESEEHHIVGHGANDTLVNNAPTQSNLTLDNQEIELVIDDGETERDLSNSSDRDSTKLLAEEQTNAGERIELVINQEADHVKEMTVISERLQSLEAEKQELAKYIMKLQATLERNRMELNTTRSDLEQHKARAFKTLQEKEKLITELRSNESIGLDDATVMELNQIRQERDSLREENLQISEQLRIVRDELTNADIKLEKIRQKTNESTIQAQEILNTERRRRLDVEEDARIHSQEARSLKDEVLRLRNTYTTQLQKQDAEIARLRLQLSASLTPSSAVETRLATLTQTLVMKQQALENLTTERNALRLQLEKLEHEFRNMRRNASCSTVNDTDDAKAQVPTFLMETPFDTGVTRRVKRAYSSLDAISIRTGVFLRRYPLARILVLIYMALLQFWVLVVLFSQSPEAH